MPQPSGKSLGFWMAVALVMGSMVGSGIFLLPSSLAPYGALGLAGWIVSTGGAIALALVFATLARTDPAAGGPYAYTRRAFGDLPAFLVAWGYWISMWSSLGALAVAFVGYLDPFIPQVVRAGPAAALLAILTIWLLVGVNSRGVRHGGWVQAVTTVLKVLPLIAVGVAGLATFAPSHFVITQSGPKEIASVISSTATLTLWAFVGLEAATVPSGSIEDPARTIPRATVVDTLLAAGIYIVGTLGVMSLMPQSALAQSTAPYADAARTIAGDGAARAVALGAAISCFGALNGWVLLVGQLPLAVARDGLFPPLFGRLTSRGTPAAGMVVAALLASALVLMNYKRGLVELFTFIILLSTLSTLIPYVFCAMAVFVLGDAPEPRGIEPPAANARASIRAGLAVIAAVAFAYSLWAIGGAGADTVYWGFLLLLAGLPVYVFVVRGRPVPQPASPIS